LAPAKDFKYKICPVNSHGLINLEKLQKLINDKTILVSIGYVNNEIGVVQPLKEISSLLRQIRKNRLKNKINRPIYLHSDAAQAPGHVDLHVSRLGIDLLSINGSKIYGPKQ